MREFLDCKKCGGRREHDLRTGEVESCDTCDEGSQEEIICNEETDL